MDSEYVLRGRAARPLKLLLWSQLALSVLGLAGIVVAFVLQSALAPVAIAVTMLASSLALLVGFQISRAHAAQVRLRLLDKGMEISSERGEEYLRWADVERVDVQDNAARFHIGAGLDTSVLIAYPGQADAPEWRQIQEDIASHLDADRGYVSRVCEFEQVPAGDSCGDLGCAGSDSCQLHALKQTRTA